MVGYFKKIILKMPVAITLLALVIILHLASYFVEIWMMRLENQRITRDTIRRFRKLFPDVASVTAPFSQMSFKLQQLKTLAGEDENNEELLALLGKTDPLMPAKAKMRGLKYGAGWLELKLALQEEKDVKAFKDSVAGIGLDVSAKPGVKEESGFVAEFMISQKGIKK